MNDSRSTPERYEAAEVSHAKDLAMDEIHKLADAAMIETGDDAGQIDAIGWADAIIERLISAGVDIPEDWAGRPAPWAADAVEGGGDQ